MRLPKAFLTISCLADTLGGQTKTLHNESVLKMKTVAVIAKAPGSLHAGDDPIGNGRVSGLNRQPSRTVV